MMYLKYKMMLLQMEKHDKRVCGAIWWMDKTTSIDIKLLRGLLAFCLT